MKLSDIDPSNWTASANYIYDERGEQVLYNLADDFRIQDDHDLMFWVLDAILEYVKHGGTTGANKRGI